MAILKWGLMLTVLITSCVFAGFGVFALQSDLEFKNWPTTEATLNDVEIITRELQKAKPGSAPVPIQAIKVSYQYRVEDQTYDGTQPSNRFIYQEIKSPNMPIAEKITELVDEIKTQSPLLAHYNPQTPTQSYLIYKGNLNAIITSFGLALAMLLLGWLGWRQVR